MTETMATGRHRLTNLDLVAETADCSVCGLGVRIKVRADASRGASARCYTQFSKGRGRNRTPEARRWHALMMKYGITEAEYLRMLAGQGGVCAICERPSAIRLCVDHNHETGEVRGLLCRGCNLSLGYLRDDTFSAVSAAKYLLSAARRSS